MRHSLSFYPSSDAKVHDKFSKINISRLCNVLAKIYVRSEDIMTWKKKKTWNVKTWSSFSWSAQSCSTSCNKAAAFRLKRMLQAFFNPQHPFCSNSGKVLRYVLDNHSSCSIYEFCSSCNTLFSVFSRFSFFSMAVGKAHITQSFGCICVSI